MEVARGVPGLSASPPRPRILPASVLLFIPSSVLTPSLRRLALDPVQASAKVRTGAARSEMAAAWSRAKWRPRARLGAAAPAVPSVAGGDEGE